MNSASVVSDPSKPTPTEAAILTRAARLFASVADDEQVDTRGARTRNAVLTASITLFARKGFEACTMKDLAGAAGVSPPALYNHFASKEQVLGDAMRAAMREFIRSIVQPILNAEPDRWLETLVTRHTLFALSKPDFAASSDLLAWQLERDPKLPPDDAEAIRRLRLEFFKLSRDLICVSTAQRQSARVTFLTHTVLAICDAPGQWVHPDRSVDVEFVVDETWRTVCRVVGFDGSAKHCTGGHLRVPA